MIHVVYLYIQPLFPWIQFYIQAKVQVRLEEIKSLASGIVSVALDRRRSHLFPLW